MRLERDFQPTLIKEIETIFPGCLVLKGDSARRQGVPYHFVSGQMGSFRS